jgi:hypothetical protein
LPINHKFWTTNYPPNGWKCRCDVDRIPYGTKPSSDAQVSNINPDAVPPLFRTNLAKDKLVFPKNHPYYQKFNAKEYIGFPNSRTIEF